MTQPRILLWDIETTHNVVRVFRLYGEQYIPHDNLVQERYIVCAAWKWFGERNGVQTVSVLDDPKRYKANPHDDKHVVAHLHNVISQADILVHHHGDAFDLKYLTARAIAHGLPKLPPIKTVDTRKVAKREFLFNSNRLDYLGHYLGLGRKLETERGLWLKVLDGDPKAVEKMVRYNKGDVRLLEKVFLKLRPYVNDALNRHLYNQDSGCPRCGSKQIQSRGTHRAIARTYQRFQCQACGGWFRQDRMVAKTTTRLVA